MVPLIDRDSGQWRPSFLFLSRGQAWPVSAMWGFECAFDGCIVAAAGPHRATAAAARPCRCAARRCAARRALLSSMRRTDARPRVSIPRKRAVPAGRRAVRRVAHQSGHRGRARLGRGRVPVRASRSRRGESTLPLEPGGDLRRGRAELGSCALDIFTRARPRSLSPTSRFAPRRQLDQDIMDE